MGGRRTNDGLEVKFLIGDETKSDGLLDKGLLE
ncbi:hypothetical protein A2U01_0108100, partial [Trifolium medium]|nr:hypothetical protein [Trifolium medium]